MRVDAGTEIKIFDGRSGEWWCKLNAGSTKIGCAGDKSRIDNLCALAPELGFVAIETAGVLTERIREQLEEPDLWLLFAPVKGSALDTIVQKATELGSKPSPSQPLRSLHALSPSHLIRKSARSGVVSSMERGAQHGGRRWEGNLCRWLQGA
jgi:16S rRNA U1498 N3-methylase RsmE